MESAQTSMLAVPVVSGGYCNHGRCFLLVQAVVATAAVAVLKVVVAAMKVAALPLEDIAAVTVAAVSSLLHVWADTTLLHCCSVLNSAGLEERLISLCRQMKMVIAVEVR